MHTPVGNSGLLSKQDYFWGQIHGGGSRSGHGRLEPLPGLDLAPLLNSRVLLGKPLTLYLCVPMYKIIIKAAVSWGRSIT